MDTQQRHSALRALVAAAMALLIAACGELPSAPDTDLTGEQAFSTVAPDVAVAEAPYVLVFDMENPPADVEALVSAAGGELMMDFPEVGIAVANTDAADFAAVAGANETVESVGPTGTWSLPTTDSYLAEFDAPTPTDWAYYVYQWDIRRVGADAAWAATATGSHSTVVAIIDQGVDFTHPDLAPNAVYWACYELAGPCGDLYRGWHGTHVAGTVAAAFGGGYVVGVGPNLGLASYQVFESGGGAWDLPIWTAMIDAAVRGFDVINMSLGGYSTFAQTDGSGAAAWTAWNRVANYVTRMGVTIVASAGNGAVNVNGTLFHIPGDVPAIVNVAATGIRPHPAYPQDDVYDVPAFYSNSGAAVTLSAPGGDCGLADGCDSGTRPANWYEYLILSTYPGPAYVWSAGTSMASPHVAGAAGLIIDENPDLNPRQVAAILRRSADMIGSRQIFGHGMLDVLGAVEAAR